MGRVFLGGLAASAALCWLASAVGSASAAPPPVVPGEVVVRFAAGAGPRLGGALSGAARKAAGGGNLRALSPPGTSRLADVLEQYGALGGESLGPPLGKRGKSAQRTKAGESLYRLVFPASVDTGAVISAIESTAGVVYAEPNYIGRLFLTPTDPLFVNQQADLDVIGARDAWDVQAGATNSVVVAVIDSGCEAGHPDLGSALDLANSYNFVDGNATVFDDLGHGTRVSGIIGAAANNSEGIAGVAFGCRILSLDVTDSAGSVTTARVASALSWASTHGAQVANMSFGFNGYSQVLEDACEEAAEAGVLLVAAAGNENQGSKPVYPASFDSVIGVGALAEGGTTRAAWSNYNGTDGSLVDLVAPGDTVFSSIPGSQYNGAFGSGTSFSAPLVSATGALLLAMHPSQSAGAIRRHLLATAEPVGAGFLPPGGAGAGKLNAKAALETAMVPSLGVLGVRIDDSTTVYAGNNNDGTLDKGETVRLAVTLLNSAADATGVSATLSTPDSLVSISDASGAWGEIENKAEVEGGDDYTISLSGASLAHPIKLQLAVKANGGDYTANLDVGVQGENSVTVPAGSYFAAQTWTSGNTYEVTGTQNFNGGLTIQPGTVVKLGPAADLNVNAGAFTANGTAEQPILVTALQGPDAYVPMQFGPRTETVNLGAYEQVRYIDIVGGSDTTGDGSAGSPWKTINHAYSQVNDATASNRYAFLVARGTYAGVTINMESFIDLYGGFEATGWTRDIAENATVLDGEGVRRVATADGNVILDGVSVLRGSSLTAGGLLIVGSPVRIQSCLVARNVATDGGGVYVDSGATGVTTVKNCIMSDNTGDGGAIKTANNGGVLSVAGSAILHNYQRAVYSGVGRTLTIEGCLLAENSNQAVYVYSSGSASLKNSLFLDNVAFGAIDPYAAGTFDSPVQLSGVLAAGNRNGMGNPSGFMAANQGVVDYSNCILLDSPPALFGGGQQTISYCDLQPNLVGGATNIDNDPLFVPLGIGSVVLSMEYRQGADETVCVLASNCDPAAGVVSISGHRSIVLKGNGAMVVVGGDATRGGTVSLPAVMTVRDYHLLSSSPCVDTGTNVGAPATDIEGDPRPINGGTGLTADMGVDEYNPASPPYQRPGRIYIKSASTGSSISHFTIEECSGLRNESPSTMVTESDFRNNASTGLLSTAGIDAITSCTASGNLSDGISAGSRPLINCNALHNLDVGLRGADITDCSAYGNGEGGIVGTAVVTSTAEFNGGDGIRASGGVSGSVALRNSARGIVCTAGVVGGATASRNGAEGISIDGGGGVTGTLSSQNAGAGVVASGASVLSYAEVVGNGGAGVSGSGSTTVSNSIVSDNGGLAVQGVSTLAGSRVVGNGSGVSGVGTIASSYIAANGGAGITGGSVADSTVLGNSGPGVVNGTSLNNSWVMGNSGVGVDAPVGSVISCSILRNGGYGVRNLPGVALLNGNNIHSNALYEYYDNSNNSSGGYPANVKDIRFNYWGPSATAQMTSNPFPSVNITRLYDLFDNGQANGWYANYGGLGEFASSSIAGAPSSAAPAFLVDVLPDESNAVNVGETAFVLTFSEPMNSAFSPAVTFDQVSPYQEHVVEPDPGWISSTTWQGRFWIQSDTGDGLNTIRVSNATAVDGFVIPDDISHHFVLDTSGGGSANNGLASATGSDSFSLNWSVNGLPATAQGFNVRRSATGVAGSFERVNTSLVIGPPYSDGGLSPATLYYYQIDVVYDGGNANQWTPPFYGMTLAGSEVTDWSLIDE